ncbi:MAG: aminoacyl-tRNA hydrolase [Deltaproteobacteria bacterium]|nr:aminoacyl-tRNA hydrolase [Deltaproteobacteria bacterium]MBW2661004.1 aminoacyl-tRNA hydrolase [Deltaproteobacteria bacterium]
MLPKKACLIVGLGNPGSQYVETRHNAGFIAIDKIANSYSVLVEKSKFNALYCRCRIENIDVILAKPMAFMNKSGHPVQQIAGYFKISCQDILIIHDDIDLAFGRLQIKERGGSGGHKGIKSIIDAFGRDDFARIRIGISHENFRNISGVSNYVLSRFSPDERLILPKIITRTKDAVVTILSKGIKEGMNVFNKKNIFLSSP